MSSLRLALKLSMEAPPQPQEPKVVAAPKRKRSSSDVNHTKNAGNNSSDDSDGVVVAKRSVVPAKGARPALPPLFATLSAVGTPLTHLISSSLLFCPLLSPLQTRITRAAARSAARHLWAPMPKVMARNTASQARVARVGVARANLAHMRPRARVRQSPRAPLRSARLLMTQTTRRRRL